MLRYFNGNKKSSLRDLLEFLEKRKLKQSVQSRKIKYIIQDVKNFKK